MLPDGYHLQDFQFPHILDKKIPGCGYTEYCIRNSMNIILCSPRRILLENKEQQHMSEVLYFRNILEPDPEVDENMNKTRKRPTDHDTTSDVTTRENYLRGMENQLREYVLGCYTSRRPCKILVTYDSFRLVKDILLRLGRLDDFYIVIDEMQVVFTDSRFKSSTELDFVNQIRGIRGGVCFVSATPMIDKYLKRLDYFKDLPYYEFDWEALDPTRIIKPDLKVRVLSSIVSCASDIISPYLEGNYSRLLNTKGEWIESKEAVLYVNSVKNICDIIRRCRLTLENTNILCSDTPENEKRLREAFGVSRKLQGLPRYKKDTKMIGKVPLQGEPHKMFTICTRTVYLGADFYSTNARTFILSDANIDSLAVDISLDLPQIMGRQRLTENPWKNHAEFYYKTIGRSRKLTQKDFDDLVEKKLESTKKLLSIYKSTEKELQEELAYKYEKDIYSSMYKDDYVAVNVHSGSTLIPCFNELVFIAEQRAFDIQQIDYANRFSVFNTIQNTTSLGIDKSSEYIQKVLKNTRIDFPERLKDLCETPDFSVKEKKVIAIQAGELFDLYYNGLGPERCRALSYNTTKMKKEISTLSRDNRTRTKMIEEIKASFRLGERYFKKNIKTTLKEIYSKYDHNKAAKASDIKEWFRIKEVQFKNPETGTKDMGFEILCYI